MPILNWSLGALAVLKDTDKRKEKPACSKNLLPSGRERMRRSVPLSLLICRRTAQAGIPLIARFSKTNGWVVEAELQQEHRKVMFGV